MISQFNKEKSGSSTHGLQAQRSCVKSVSCVLRERAIQQHVGLPGVALAKTGVLLVKMFWTSKTSCRARRSLDVGWVPPA